MAKNIGALKTTILGGARFMIPFVILLAIASKAYEVMERFAAPIAKAIGIERIGAIAVINIVTIGALVAVCYVAGLLATSDRGKRAYRTLDEKMLDLFPRYGFVKSMAAGFHQETTSSMQVVLVCLDDQSQIGFEVERNPGQVAVFLPGSPDPWSGAVVVVAADDDLDLQHRAFAGPEVAERIAELAAAYVQNLAVAGRGEEVVLVGQRLPARHEGEAHVVERLRAGVRGSRGAGAERRDAGGHDAVRALQLERGGRSRACGRRRDGQCHRRGGEHREQHGDGERTHLDLLSRR